MEIYAGSPNASRIPGQFAYPVQRYSNQAIAPVGRISANHPEHLRRVQNHLDQINASEMRATYERTQREADIPGDYTNAAFKSKEIAERGLFLNILG